jgi:DNA polymerase-3 subunit alpha/error-prone DNA polymerase
MARIVEQRQRQPFVDPADFWHRVLPSDDETRALIHAGALDSLDARANRTMLLWQWASFQRSRSLARVNSLFPVRLPEPPVLTPPDLRSRLQREYAVLGFLCGHHPLELAGRLPAGLMKMAEAGAHVGRRIRCAGWLLTGKLVSTRTGEVMEFLTFEDDTGLLETTFFPEAYRRAAHLMASGRGYILTGIVEADYGAVTLTVEQVVPIADNQGRRRQYG